MQRTIRLLAVALLLFVGNFVARSASAEPALRSGDRLAIAGDSITEQKLYSKYIEAYVLACSGLKNLKVLQFGWGGETALGFTPRVEPDLGLFKPTVVTLCYGMNDGGYRPYDDGVGANYEKNMRNVLAKLQGLIVRTIVVGSPGAVDDHFFRPGQMLGDRPAHVAYNENLGRLRDIDRRLAQENKLLFADVHQPMIDTMRRAQAALGEKYPVCGPDGFHPGPNGQLIMAYAFLKGLGFDGEIGTITVDMRGSAAASPGHTVLNYAAGAVELESVRWPFCFDGSPKAWDGTRSILPFLPFNQDLNRLTLKVTNLDAPKAQVKWGKETKEFTREQLAEGVNLAAEFDVTPFDASFKKLIDTIGGKQSFETYLIKNLSLTSRTMVGELKSDAAAQSAMQTLMARGVARQQELDEQVHAALGPVKHSLTITAVK
ncbi:MAG: SGNH/GDSL hydrolase family protein [Planctomycetes bacterium]|nr:SGNH/GDSL hydrolase family protein [Planctomycetota bacterium]